VLSEPFGVDNPASLVIQDHVNLGVVDTFSRPPDYLIFIFLGRTAHRDWLRTAAAKDHDLDKTEYNQVPDSDHICEVRDEPEVIIAASTRIYRNVASAKRTFCYTHPVCER
jgi:hypothetical protein